MKKNLHITKPRYSEQILPVPRSGPFVISRFHCNLQHHVNIYPVCCWFSRSFAPRRFSPGTPVFPSPQKPTFPNSNLIRRKNHFVDVLPPNHYLFYLFIYFIHLSFDKVVHEKANKQTNKQE